VIEPTERLLWLLALVALVGLFGLALPAIGDAAPVGLVALLVFALVDAWAAGSPRRLKVERQWPEELVQGRSVELVHRLARGADRPGTRSPLRVTLTDSLPEELVDKPWLGLEATLVPGEALRFTSPLLLRRRGTWQPGRLAIRVHGPLGLVVRRERRALPEPVTVRVDLTRVLARAEQLVTGLETSGGRRKRAFERGRELDSLREYRRGDDIRLVDWKASARHDTLVVKELRPETRQDVVVLLDCGRQLLGHHAAEDGGDLRFELALQTALILGAAVLAKGDRAGLVAVADSVLADVAPAGGKSQLRRVADSVQGLSAQALEPAYADAAQALLRRLRRRALVVVLTDVVDAASARALAQALLALRGRHLTCVVALQDPALERLARPEPVEAASAERDSRATPAAPAGGVGLSRDDPRLGQAARHLVEQRRRALAALAATGARVVDASPSQAPGLAVSSYLDLKAQGRL
jgi:uncharacterized protein (DUF58 family)